MSVLRYTAELAVSAKNSGSHGRSRLLTRIAASRLGHRDVHMASADALLVGDHAELLGDLAVARGVGDRELVRHGRRQRDGEQLRAVGLGGFGGDRGAAGSAAARSSSLPLDDVGRGLDLAAGQLELRASTPRSAAWSATALFTATGSPVVGSTRRNSSSTPKVGWLAMAEDIDPARRRSHDGPDRR